MNMCVCAHLYMQVKTFYEYKYALFGTYVAQNVSNST